MKYMSLWFIDFSLTSVVTGNSLLHVQKKQESSAVADKPATRCNVIVPPSPSGGTPSNITKICTPMKSTFSALQFCRWQYGSISICLAVIAFQMYEIARNSKKIRTYSSSRSSKVIDLGVNRKPMYDFLLDASPTVFEILTHLAQKYSYSLFLPPLPCLTPPSGGTPWYINIHR